MSVVISSARGDGMRFMQVSSDRAELDNDQSSDAFRTTWWSPATRNVVSDEHVCEVLARDRRATITRDVIHVIGFTGTASGCPSLQLVGCTNYLAQARRDCGDDVVPVFVHGDCIGADAQVVYEAWLRGFVCIAWPGHDKNGLSPKRARTPFNAIVHDPLPYLERNDIIMSVADEALAAAGSDYASPRSGTRHAVTRAVHHGKSLFIVTADGSTRTTP